MKISGATAGAVMVMMMACLYAPMVSAAMTSMAGDEIQIDGGKSYLNNNQWGAADVDEGWQQVFYHSEHDMGWRWHWPSTTESVKAYPALVTGWHWSSNYDPRSHLPAALSSLHHVRTHARFALNADGRYNVAYDLWCHTSPRARWYSSPAAEVMVWLRSINVHPAGDYKGRVTIDGRHWGFYVGSLPTGWPVYTFVLEEGTDDLSMDLQPLLGSLARTGYWRSDALFLSSVEFGSEIYSGSGELHLLDWQLEID